MAVSQGERLRRDELVLGVIVDVAAFATVVNAVAVPTRGLRRIGRVPLAREEATARSGDDDGARAFVDVADGAGVVRVRLAGVVWPDHKEDPRGGEHRIDAARRLELRARAAGALRDRALALLFTAPTQEER